MQIRADLSPREREILRMMAGGLTDKEIAADLGARPHTISNYVSIILLKLGAANRTQAVAEAFQRGILPVDHRENSLGKTPRAEIPGE